MKYKNIYFIGIKGVGMTALSILSKEAGYAVGGCDTADEFVTEEELKKANIAFDISFDLSNLMKFSSMISETLIISTAAHGGLGNPLVKKAQEMGLTVLSYGQALGKFMDGSFLSKNIQGISIAGAHGKTTVSALLSSCMTLLNFDPSYIVGAGSIFPIGLGGHYGKGDYFIAESDEYAADIIYDKVPKFFYQHPKIAIINNIDFDHPDFYNSIEDVENAFSNFLKNIKDEGVLIINGDDERAVRISRSVKESVKIITYGQSLTNDYVISRYKENGLGSSFFVEGKEVQYGEFRVSIPGFHNACNALPVIALLSEIGVSITKIKEVLPKFTGTRRRMEFVKKLNSGSILFDDYAHHPLEIKATLSALKKAYPAKKILCIFQPHTISRTRSLIKSFAASFYDADTLIWLPIYSTSREDGNVEDLESEIRYEFDITVKQIIMPKDRSNVIEYVNENVTDHSFVVITMGAGDVYKIGQELS